MSGDLPPRTIADVLHHMYMASADPYRFPAALAAVLGIGVGGLRALYDQPAPDPEGPDFDERVLTIAARRVRRRRAGGAAARVVRGGRGTHRLIACRSTPPGPGDMSDAGCFLYE